MFEKLSAINVNEHTEDKNGLTYLSWTWAWSEFKKQCPNADYEIEKFDNNLPYVYDENTGYMVFTRATNGEEWKEMWLPVMDGNNKAMLNHPYTYKVKEYKEGKWTGGYTEKTVEQASMFDINKTIMRCLVKNIGMFGLGIYIYAGEDMPEGYEITKEEASKIIINFGKKHPGETLGDILKSDKNYLYWLIGQDSTKQSLKDAIAVLIDMPNKDEQQERIDLIDEIMRLSQEKDIDIEEICEKFKVESLSDMTTDNMKLCIEKMKEKEV